MSSKESLFRSLHSLHKVLRIQKNSTSWRNSLELFSGQSGWLKPGVFNVAPAWFEQAREVDNIIGV